MNEIKCTLCEADFRADVVTEVPAGVPKCPSCAKEHPGALTRAEIQVETENKAETLSEERVEAIVYDILDQAGLPRNKCEKCHAMFFRRKPMQMNCEACGGLKKDEGKKGDK